MATKNILLAIADNQTIANINEALGDEWLSTPVASEADALALLEAGSFDVLLADFNFGEEDASGLLNEALEKCPNTARFLFAHEADLALVAAKVLGDHEILPKPIEYASLKNRIEQGLNEASASPASSEPTAATAPAIPAVYDEVLNALNSPDVTSESVGNIIATDDALNQEVLMLTRSAYLGLPGKIIEPVEAVEVLGLETVKTLVTARKFLAEHAQVRPGYLSVEQIWQHSTHVAQIARDLVLFETKDRAMASQALAAGLVHDLGKVVLATNYDDLYGRVHSLARKQPVPLWEIEKEMFGASHGEIGACLLGMWNLPIAIVDATAFHHEPPLGEHTKLSPLAAVHIANVLEHQLHPSDELRVVPTVSTPFLNELGLLQRLPIWRATFGNQRARTKPADAGPAVTVVAAVLEEGATSHTANQLAGPATATQTATAAPTSRAWLRQWIYTGVVAGIAFALALMLRLETDPSTPEHVHARQLGGQETAVVAPSTPAPAVVPEVVAPVVSEVAPEVALAADTVTEAPAMATVVIPEPPTVTNAPPTNVVVTSVPTQETAPSFRLNGIIYGVANPSAVVNGKTVFVGERVSGATVISIGRSAVTLEINGERKTVSLPGVR